MRRKFSIILPILFFVLSFFLFSIETGTVFAGCVGDCSGSLNCNIGKPGFCSRDDCRFKFGKDEYSCSKGGNKAVCGCYDRNNKGLRCVQDGSGCTNNGNVCTCSCTPKSCPPGNDANKYMTKSVSNGYGTKCTNGGCDGEQYACEDKHVNTPPTCSMLPDSIDITRGDDPERFTLRVKDNDWGDTVKITGYEVVDNQGDLNSCVNVTTVEGNSISNLVVRPGSNDSSVLAKNTNLLADPTNAFGIYNSNGLCSGKINIEIRDVDSDGNGPDVSDTVTCSVNITVHNDKPQVSNIQINDYDSANSLRRSGNLATQYRVGDGNGALPVGSLWDERRVARCTSPIDITNDFGLGVCPDTNWEPKATRTNPYLLSFTVSDVQGIEDIKDLGFWIQRSDLGTYPKVPVSDGAFRSSIQAMIGDLKNYTISSNKYFTSAPCLGSICSRNITDMSLFGFTLTNNKPSSAEGNISNSVKSRSVYSEWLKSDFPNCLYRGICGNNNVPDTSKTNAGSDINNWRNYDWNVSASDGKMLCLTSNDTEGSSSGATKAIDINSEGICPISCSACVALNTLEPNATNPDTAVDASFIIWMNDKYINNGQDPLIGMEEGIYNVYVGASDKVNGKPFGNNFYGAVVGTWASNVPSANKFRLNFDFEPPVVSEFVLSTGEDLVSVNADGILTEPTGQSGVSGWTNRFMIYENAEDSTAPKGYMDKDPAGTSQWLGNEEASTPFPITDGLSGTARERTFTYTGYGLDSTTSYHVMGGFCAYDKAGNMCCVRSVIAAGSTDTDANKVCANYGTTVLNVRYPWLQTTLGSIYSNTTGAAVAMTFSSNSEDITSQDDRVPSNLSQEFGIALGGMFVSGGVSSGLNTGETNLGYVSDARTSAVSDVRNIYNLADASNDRNWYSVLYSLVSRNCDLREGTGKECSQTKNIGDAPTLIGEMALDSSSYVRVQSNITIDSKIYCKGTHLIFVDSGISLELSEVVKRKIDNGTSGCMFILDEGAKFTILNPDFKNIDNDFDRFDAAVVVSDGATFITKNSNTLIAANESDRLQIYGFLYSNNKSQPPYLGRNLVEDATKDYDDIYPAEWFVYDANLLTVFRDLLGNNRSVDVTCGTSEHVLCQ